MIFNETKNYKFSTRLMLNDTIVETLTETKLLGTIIENNFSWNSNTSYLIKKAYSRMQLLRKIVSFNVSMDDLKHIYIICVRSLLEQSCNVWHSMLTQENRDNLERVQKSALKIILDQQFKNYENALNILDLDTLEERRDKLCLSSAIKSTKNEKMKSFFILNNKNHQMNTRNKEKYIVNFANRFQNSPILYMQRKLNEHLKK